MSRLLDSLQKAQQERSGQSPDSASKKDESETRPAQQPGYFWTSMFLLVLVCGLIVGGFLLLQYQLYGIEPAEWLERLLSRL
jgi:quinol-cytochrome oxidoreductase complex cytochrome b subunit